MDLILHWEHFQWLWVSAGLYWTTCERDVPVESRSYYQNRKNSRYLFDSDSNRWSHPVMMDNVQIPINIAFLEKWKFFALIFHTLPVIACTAIINYSDIRGLSTENPINAYGIPTV